MTNDYSEISNRDQAFELVVRHALKIKTWQRKCSKMMKQHKISKESVELEIAHRKAILEKKSSNQPDFKAMPHTEDLKEVATALAMEEQNYDL